MSGKGDPSSCHEEAKGVIRVKDYEQTLALQPSKNGLGTKGEVMQLCADLKYNFTFFIIVNWNNTMLSDKSKHI